MLDGRERAVLREWKTILGDDPAINAPQIGRTIWPVVAEDERAYFLKRLGPWRNLPLADEARVLGHLSQSGVGVAEFLPTDAASFYAGSVDELFVLIPCLPAEKLSEEELLAAEPAIGAAMATMHRALASYPWPTNSYSENLGGALTEELSIPVDVEELFDPLRARMVQAIEDLPLQIVHGDMTPENILLQRPDRVVGFIDFEHLPHAPRAWDLAKYMSRRLRVGWRDRSDVSDTDRLRHLARALSGYVSVSMLDDAEIDALPWLVLAANVIEISYFRQVADGRLQRRMLPDHLQVLEDSEEAARWHLHHLDDVAAAVQRPEA